MKQNHFNPIHYILQIVFFMCIPLFVSAQKKTPNNSKDNLIVSGIQIDSVMHKYVSQGFSGSILIVKNGKKIFNKAYGFANKLTETKNGTKTRFNVASISKIFCAAAI